MLQSLIKLFWSYGFWEFFSAKVTCDICQWSENCIFNVISQVNCAVDQRYYVQRKKYNHLSTIRMNKLNKCKSSSSVRNRWTQQTIECPRNKTLVESIVRVSDEKYDKIVCKRSATNIWIYSRLTVSNLK